MHIMEGYLPLKHAAFWSAISLPFLCYGGYRLKRKIAEAPQVKLILGASSGFCFVLSALKLPSITGSCSHPTGIGLGATLFGPWIRMLVGAMVLLFQALLLAHGGLTTLGANIFSMAIVGSLVAFIIFRSALFFRAPFSIAVFLAAVLSDLATYITTSLQLALAFPDASSGFTGAAIKFMAVFAVTQIPLALSEGLLSVLTMNLLCSNAGEQIREAGLLPKGVLS